MTDLQVVENNQPAEEYKMLKFTNPAALGYVAPFIKTFVEKINMPNMRYESMYAYLQRSIQFNHNAEFWVVYEGEEPVAFAHWYVRDLPYIATCYGDIVHSWNRKREPVLMLVEKFIEFGKSHRCVWYSGDTINPTLFRVFRKAFNKKGMDIKDMNSVHFLGREKSYGW